MNNNTCLSKGINEYCMYFICNELLSSLLSLLTCSVFGRLTQQLLMSLCELLTTKSASIDTVVKGLRPF